MHKGVFLRTETTKSLVSHILGKGSRIMVSHNVGLPQGLPYSANFLEG